MKRAEYLDELRKQLQVEGFPHVEEAVSYFSEMLDDRIEHERLDEEAAIAMLESPQQAAKHLAMQVDKAPEQSTKGASSEEDFTPGIRTINMKASLVRSITVHDRNNSILVEGWDRDEVEVKHVETEKIRYEVILENGAFSLTREPIEFSMKWFMFDISTSLMNKVLIKVPHEMAAALNLRTSNSKIELEGVSFWGKMDLGTSNSSIRLFKVDASQIHAKTSNSKINLEQVRAQKALEAVTSNGSIIAEKVTAPESLHLQTSNGKIEVHDIESQAITLITSNAGVKGELPGFIEDYTIESATSNGKNTLPHQQTGGGKTLRVKTSNANISLEFRG